jgi:NAD(P)-dependent dehydrogenase (short-subunit alcohol dehydrogenase family)
MEIRGARALVTGASRGLGAALAERLARGGARVVLVARGGEPLARVVEAIRAAGGEAHGVALDVGDKEAAHAIAGTAAALVGPIDLLVQNASTLGHAPLRPLLDTDCEAFERALAVNVVGPMRLAKLLVGPMVLRRRGLVVQVTSDASVMAYPGWAAYGVSKAALDHMGRVLAAEIDGTGVRVVTVDPGEMRTAMHADAMPEADPSTLLEPEIVAARLVALIRDADAIPNGARVEAARWGSDGSVRSGAEAAS